MKIVAISDTHNEHARIDLPEGDMIIHAGDSCTGGTAREFYNFYKWFKSLDYKYKIFVAGNHDGYLWDQDPPPAEGVYYLRDNFVVIEGLKIYGSPWTSVYGDWWFMKEDYELTRYWNGIPHDTDILVTHSPIYGINDYNLGSNSLADRVKHVDLKLHVCGHIHEGYGVTVKDNITYVNAAIMRARESFNAPIIIESLI